MFRKFVAFAASVLCAVPLLAVVPAASAVSAEEVPTVYLAGDSTVASYAPSQYPLTGWGQMLPEFLDGGVRVDNRAIGGRSSKSYVLEGHLDKILADIQPGDYLFVQFGHNDRQNTDNLCSVNKTYCNRHTEPYTSFKEYLAKYVTGAREHGATPVLVTPMGRRSYDDKGQFLNDFYDYAQAMKQLSAEYDVPLIDLNSTSIAFYTRIGVPATEEIFLYCDPGECENYQTGREDNVHFQEYGARWLARFVAEGIGSAGLPMAQHVEFDDADPWNLATNAVVTASSSLETDGWYRWNLTDGQLAADPHGMGWSSNDQTLNLVDHSEWVSVDLGAVSPLTRVLLAPRSDEGKVGRHFPVDYRVQVSEDGAAWTTVASAAAAPVPTAPQELRFPATRGRYVKVTGTRLRQDPADLTYRMQLGEVKVYSDVVSMRLTGPAELLDGATGAYVANLRVPPAAGEISNVRFDLRVPDGWSSRKVRERLPYFAAWDVTAPKAGRGTDALALTAVVTYRQAGTQHTTTAEVLVGKPVPPPPPQPGEHWVSDLPFAEEVNGWGPVERDASNGEDLAGDGRPLSIGDVGYAKGLGTHADSAVTIALDQCKQFSAVVGVDDEVGDGGSVSFMVEADGALVWTHPIATGGDGGQAVALDVTGVSKLRLVVDDLANKGHDHADWAAAKLTGCAS